MPEFEKDDPEAIDKVKVAEVRAGTARHGTARRRPARTHARSRTHARARARTRLRARTTLTLRARTGFHGPVAHHCNAHAAYNVHRARGVQRTPPTRRTTYTAHVGVQRTARTLALAIAGCGRGMLPGDQRGAGRARAREVGGGGDACGIPRGDRLHPGGAGRVEYWRSRLGVPRSVKSRELR